MYAMRNRRTKCFYSRPSARGDANLRYANLSGAVSTHAPLRGATGWLDMPNEPSMVSTHAPLRGATRYLVAITGSKAVSTHAPLRGATGDVWSLAQGFSVSTHAPLRGATSVSASSGTIFTRFYSRPSARGDAKCRFGITIDAAFLLTPLCEGRPLPASHWRTRAKVSTHAPLRGATIDAATGAEKLFSVSTHAPLRGATSAGQM